jgi:hypothetical protein
LDQTHVNRNKTSIIIGFFFKKEKKIGLLVRPLTRSIYSAQPCLDKLAEKKVSKVNGKRVKIK